MSGEGFVYFIQSGDEGPLKIGWAKDPKKRLREFQTANPKTLRLRGAIAGSQEDEQDFHALFAHHRIRGEWFNPCQCIFNHITFDEPPGFRVEPSSGWACEPLRIPRFKNALEAPAGWTSGIATPWRHDDLDVTDEESDAFFARVGL